MPSERDLNQAEIEKKRRALLDTRGTDKVYKSGDVSALGRQSVIGDTRLREGRVPRPIPDNNSNLTQLQRIQQEHLVSSDKYYRSAADVPVGSGGGNVGGNIPQAALPPAAYGNRGRSGYQRLPVPASAANVINLRIDKPEDVVRVIDAAVSRVLSSYPTPIVVEVAPLPGLIMRARTALDQRIAREAITEDQGRDITLRLLTPEAAAAAPAPAPVVKTAAPVPPPAAAEPESFPPPSAPEVAAPLAEAPPAAEDEDNDFFAEDPLDGIKEPSAADKAMQAFIDEALGTPEEVPEAAPSTPPAPPRS
jgi:hypothetical protein